MSPKPAWHKPFFERREHFRNPVARKLCEIAAAKKSNLILSADVTSSDELLTLADKLGPTIAVLKTHIDILEDFTPEVIEGLRHLADKHDFLLFEDRKFADIGSTVVHQCRGGIYQIALWADIINAHIVSGPGIIASLKQACEGRDVMLLLVSELSAKGTLAKGDYHQTALEFAETDPDFASGFIAQQRHESERDFLYLSPGVHLQQKGDALDQQYRGPEQAIAEQGADFIIVGRGIIASDDPEQTAEAYRASAWDAYLSSRCPARN